MKLCDYFFLQWGDYDELFSKTGKMEKILCGLNHKGIKRKIFKVGESKGLQNHPAQHGDSKPGSAVAD